MQPLLPNCKTIALPRIYDPRGSLSFVEEHTDAPFEIKRVYYIYDVPFGSVRGSHAHYWLQQIIIPLAGSFKVTIQDGLEKQEHLLSSPCTGLYICPMIWRTLSDFSSGSVCLVLASQLYSEDDYIRCYDNYLSARQSQ